MNWAHSIMRACPALALAGVLAIAGPTYAHGGGHGGGGHGGGGHGGGFHGGGFHGGGYHGGFHGGGYRGYGYGGRGYRGYGYGGRGYRGYGYGGYGYGGFYPWYGLGLGMGYYPYYSGYNNYPGYYSSGNSYDSYPYYPSYGNSDADYYTSTPTYQSYYPPTNTAPVANAVHLNVWVPAADAKVWIDGTLTQQSGMFRQFESPALKPGSNYSYQVRAEWTQNGKTVERTQTVSFHAGQVINVDLTKPATTAS